MNKKSILIRSTNIKNFLCVIGDCCNIIKAEDWHDAFIQLFVWDNGTNNVVEKAIRGMDKFEDAKVIFDKFAYDSNISYFGEVDKWFINSLEVIEEGF